MKYIVLSGAWDSDSPHRLVLPDKTYIWRSPVGAWCTFFTQMGEDGKLTGTILAFKHRKRITVPVPWWKLLFMRMLAKSSRW